MTDTGPAHDNPWTRLSRTVVYQNPWITLFHDEVRRPDGLPGIYGVVHYRNRAVGVVPLDEQDRVLLVGQYRYTLDLYSWEIPEGGGGMEEELLAAAQRELLEETGYSAGAGTSWCGRTCPTRSVMRKRSAFWLRSCGPESPVRKGRSACNCAGCRWRKR